MILTHMVMFRFFDGASAADGGAAVNAALYSKLHQGPGFAF